MNILPAHILFLLLSHQIVSSSMRREFVIFAAYGAPRHMLFAFVGTQYILDWETLIFKIWVLGKHLFLLSCNNTQWKEHSPSLSDPCTRVHTHTHTHTHTHLQHFFFFFPCIPSSAQALCLTDWIPPGPLACGHQTPLCVSYDELGRQAHSCSSWCIPCPRGSVVSSAAPVCLFPLSSQDSWSRFRERGFILNRSTVDLQCFSYTAKWFSDMCVCVCVCVCIYNL